MFFKSVHYYLKTTVVPVFATLIVLLQINVSVGFKYWCYEILPWIFNRDAVLQSLLFLPVLKKCLSVHLLRFIQHLLIYNIFNYKEVIQGSSILRVVVKCFSVYRQIHFMYIKSWWIETLLWHPSTTKNFCQNINIIEICFVELSSICRTVFIDSLAIILTFWIFVFYFT